MFIGILKLELHIPTSNSLKHKRMILNSLKGKLRNNFNVSVAEVDDHDKWQRTTIAICYVGLKKTYIHKTTEELMNFVEHFNDVDILKHEMEIL